MAKFALKSQARTLRIAGTSIKDIALQLGISKSTASTWCADIVLSDAHTKALKDRRIRAGHKGRLAGTRFHKEQREKKIRSFQDAGLKATKSINNQDLFMVGLGLYMGEGNKSGNKFQFTNSNPALVKIMVLWLKRNFQIPKDRIYCRVLINEIHADRIEKVEYKWSRLLGVPRRQFRKTILIKSKSKKTYENRDVHLGTLVLRVQRSSELQYRVLGLLNGVMYNINAKMPA